MSNVIPITWRPSGRAYTRWSRSIGGIMVVAYIEPPKRWKQLHAMAGNVGGWFAATPAGDKKGPFESARDAMREADAAWP